jgi:DNA-binding transcriptional LysR family regulator
MVEPSQDALVVKQIGRTVLGFYAHERCLEGRKEPENFADLAEFATIGIDRDTVSARSLFEKYPALETISPALKTDNQLVHLAAIRAGVGIGICQVNIARRDPSLRRILADSFAPHLGIWIVMHENLRSTPRCRAVFDHLVAGLTAYVNG